MNVNNLTSYSSKALSALDLLTAGPNALDWALAYAAAGMPVFPVKANKVPLMDRGLGLFHGHKHATTDPEPIRRWWGKFPFVEIGYAVPADIVVLDVEAAGYASFERLAGKPVNQFETPQASSRSGGVHLYFDANGRRFKNKVKFAGAMDTKTIGGSVMLPSPGNGRDWLKPLTVPMLPAPEWIPDASTDVSYAAAECKPFLGDNPKARAELSRACFEISHARYGRRNDTCNRAAYTIGGLIASGTLDYEPTVATLLTATRSLDAYPSERRAFEKCVLSAVERGMKKPWAPDEDWWIPDEVAAQILTPHQFTELKMIQAMLRGGDTGLEPEPEPSIRRTSEYFDRAERLAWADPVSLNLFAMLRRETFDEF